VWHAIGFEKDSLANSWPFTKQFLITPTHTTPTHTNTHQHTPTHTNTHQQTNTHTHTHTHTHKRHHLTGFGQGCHQFSDRFGRAAPGSIFESREQKILSRSGISSVFREIIVIRDPETTGLPGNFPGIPFPVTALRFGEIKMYN
jgi:hypothetical protein